MHSKEAQSHRRVFKKFFVFGIHYTYMINAHDNLALCPGDLFRRLAAEHNVHLLLRQALLTSALQTWPYNTTYPPFQSVLRFALLCLPNDVRRRRRSIRFVTSSCNAAMLRQSKKQPEGAFCSRQASQSGRSTDLLLHPSIECKVQLGRRHRYNWGCCKVNLIQWMDGCVTRQWATTQTNPIHLAHR